jgi:hypothetical protein
MNSSVQLIFKTTDINADNTAATYYGTQAAPLTVTTSMTWYNINMRALLGDLYDKYERFNISLNFAAGSSTGTIAENNTAADNRMLQVKMKGLPFISSFNVNQDVNIGQVCFNTISIPLTSYSPWNNNYFTQQFYTFTKQDMVNITIDLHTILTDTFPAPDSNTKMIGHCVFSFNIYGIEDFKNVNDNNKIDLTEHRATIGKLEKKLDR